MISTPDIGLSKSLSKKHLLARRKSLRDLFRLDNRRVVVYKRIIQNHNAAQELLCDIEVIHMKQIDRQNGKFRWFRTNTHDPECIKTLQVTCRANDRWFYAMHEPDDDDGTPHLHLVIMRSPAKISTVSRQLGIDENFIQPSLNYKRDVRYLNELDNEHLSYN